MKLSLIVAMACNRAIGLNQQMPWHLSADLQNFKKITMGAPIVMGRKTFESIGKALPGRTNIIISRNDAYQPDGCLVFNRLASALEYACRQHQEVFVIGGAELYRAALPLAETLYVTEINQAFQGDTFFPEFDRQDWLETQCQTIDDDPSVPFSYRFLKLERRAAGV
jgi:dihydrofolate reductase